ncbi:hypothetical protein LTR08_000866 [Meristemomyces frigidus]|nr:hypothetical protein LTR08_000866 [Meristemomyces frigidus]
MSQPLIRPSQIDTLPFLEAAKKLQYKTGLTQLWHQYEQNPQGSQQRQEAETKIRNASAKLMTEMANYKNNARPTSGGGPPQQQQARPPTQGGMAGQGHPQSQGVAPGQAPQGSGQAQGSGQMSAWVKQQLSNITVHIPSNCPPSNAAAYRQRWYQTAALDLTKKESAGELGRRMQQRMTELQSASQPVPAELTRQLNAASRTVADVNEKFARMKADNENKGRANQQAQQGGGQVQQPVQQPVHQQPLPQPQMNGTQIQRPANFQGNNHAQGDVKQEPRTSISPQQPQGNFQQQLPPPPVNQNTPGAMLQNQSMGQPPLPPQQAHHTPQAATQPQLPQHNYPQQPYPNQPRPPLNPQLSHGNVQPQQPTPTSAIPSGTTQQQQPQRPQALSQAAAMEQARQTYQNQQPTPGQPHLQQPQHANQQHPHLSTNPPFNPLPTSSSTPNNNHPTPTSATFPPNMHNGGGQPTSNMQAPNNKFPIAKSIQLDPRIHSQPVPGPASRPTLANAGMLGQPGLVRPAAYTLEGEGDRVLSKRKLDELVRQVTGGGEDGFLAAEVEDSILHMADDFVDNVVTAACKMAKLRPNGPAGAGSPPCLELRDIQMVLERNYGIRVPGYGLEEVRAVKRFQPTVEWQRKMQAVQTAKTLNGGAGAQGGKGDS